MTRISRRAFNVALVGSAGAVTRNIASAAVRASDAAATPIQSSGAADALADLTLSEASARLAAGRTTSADLVSACIARIDVYNPKVNAFITVLREQALAQAKTLDAERRAGRVRGPLHGVPIALKDNIDTAGIRTTAASAVFDDRVPTDDAEVTRRLVAAGAIVI
ncbi:MAG TPA: amidase family protein, partial [Vicinamibacterales bacterium]